LGFQMRRIEPHGGVFEQGQHAEGAEDDSGDVG
jgi:hypothetical protein